MSHWLPILFELARLKVLFALSSTFVTCTFYLAVAFVTINGCPTKTDGSSLQRCVVCPGVDNKTTNVIVVALRGSASTRSPSGRSCQDPPG